MFLMQPVKDPKNERQRLNRQLIETWSGPKRDEVTSVTRRRMLISLIIFFITSYK